MITPQRQNYKDIDILEALSKDFQCFQIKFDGIWARVQIEDGLAEVYSRTNKLKHSFEVDLPGTHVLLAEYMFGSQRAQQAHLKGRIFVFDCAMRDGEDLRDKPYHVRQTAAMHLIQDLPSEVNLVNSFSIMSASSAWKDCQGIEEGLIFRRIKDPFDAPIFRCKYEIEKTYFAVDFHEGEGKHSGRLGSISVALAPGSDPIMKVGGGFNDLERQEIWNNVNSYFDQPIVVKGKGEFESGALRHPNFVRWA
jgi:ATP-dependent DNA ligase